MKITVLFFWALIAPIMLNASEGPVNSGSRVNAQVNLWESLLSDPNSTSYLLNSNWQRGRIILQDDTSISGKAYRYNVYTDQIEVVSALSPDEVKVVEINDKLFINTTFLSENNEVKHGYFEMIEEGDMKLLIRREPELSGAAQQADHYATSGGEARVREIYYVKEGDRPAEKINLRRSDVRDFFSDKSIIQQYFEDNRILRMTESRLKEIVRHYNESVE